MPLKDVELMLSTLAEIQNLHINTCKQFNNHDYWGIFECDLIIKEDCSTPILICIPNNWTTELIDIYIKNYNNFNFIPHVDVFGKICLFKTEGLLIEHNLVGLVEQSIERAKKILLDGLTDSNKKDFIDEFESYWIQLPQEKSCYFVLPKDEKNAVIKFTFGKNKTKNNSKLFVCETQERLNQWNIDSGTFFNAAYFVLDTKDYIYPPDIRNKVSVDFLNKLLKLVPYNVAASILKKLSTEKLIVFLLKQPDGTTKNYVGFYLTGNIIDNKISFSFEKTNEVQPVYINILNKTFLMTRTNFSKFNLHEKRILVIGCGSVGGYLINELAKSGYEKITIVDNDKLRQENIFRHILGLKYLTQYKSVALKDLIEKNIPETSLITSVEKIENAISNDEINLLDYDLIISATGNHNVNRWLNSYIYKHQISVPIIYAWNEVLGIGNHVAYFKYGNAGCYNCLFKKDDNLKPLYDRTAYCEPNQDITQSIGGCADTYIPYGNSVSLRTVCMCLDLIQDIFSGKTSENLIISSKGNPQYFIEQGYKVSNRYLKQTETVEIINGSDFINKECGVCCSDLRNQ